MATKTSKINYRTYDGNVRLISINDAALSSLLSGFDDSNYEEEKPGSAERKRYIGQIGKVDPDSGNPKDVVRIEFSDGHKLDAYVDDLEPVSELLSNLPAVGDSSDWRPYSAEEKLFMDKVIVSMMSNPAVIADLGNFSPDVVVDIAGALTRAKAKYQTYQMYIGED